MRRSVHTVSRPSFFRGTTALPAGGTVSSSSRFLPTSHCFPAIVRRGGSSGHNVTAVRCQYRTMLTRTRICFFGDKSDNERTSKKVNSAMKSGFGPDPETVSYLRDPNSNKEVYLIGTAHVSQQSADDVKELIELVKPNCVMIELCQQRADKIRTEGMESVDFFTTISKALAGNNGDFLEGILRAGMASFYNVFRQMGMVPGNEFKVAMETAERNRIPIVYGDRSGDQTLHKLREALGKIDIQKFMTTKPPPELDTFLQENIRGSDIASGVEKLKDRKRIAMMSDYMAEAAPEIMQVMLTERDEHMVDSILNSCPQGRCVAVVGMAHMDGMERIWKERTEAKKKVEG